MTQRSIFSVFGVLVLIFMFLPVIVVIGVAIGASPNFQFPPTSFSWVWFVSFFTSSDYTHALFSVSLPLGLGSALVATVIGTMAAIALERFSPRGRPLLEVLFLTPLIFPQILLGAGLFLLFARLNLNPTLLTLGAGYVLLGCPYVVRTVVAGLQGLDPHIEEAAHNLGAGPVKAFWLATFPLLRSSIVSGMIFAFIVAFSDINLALFLSVVNTTTLPMQILSEMHYVSDPTIAAAAAVQIGVISVLLIIVNRLVGQVRLS